MAGWIRWFFQPAPHATDSEAKRQSVLIMLVLVFLLVVVLARWLAGYLFPLVTIWGADRLVSLVLFFAAVYTLNRTHYYRWTGSILVLTSVIYTLMLVITADTADANQIFHTLIWLLLPIALINSLYSVRTALLLTLLVNVIYLLLPLLTEQVTWVTSMSLFFYVGTLSGLVLMLKQYRDVVGADRQEALHESDSRYRVLFENSPISLWEVDYSGVKNLLDGLGEYGKTDLEAYLRTHQDFLPTCLQTIRIIDVNQASLDWLAAPDKETLIANMTSLFGPGSLKMFKRELLALSLGEPPPVAEVQMRTLAGGAIYVMRHMALAPGYEASWARCLISAVDVTKLEKAQRALQGERDFALQVMQSLGEGLTITNKDKKFEFVNVAFCRMIGYEPSELLGRSPHDFTAESHVVSLGDALQARRDGKTTSYETRLLCADGSMKDVWVTGVPRLVTGEFSGTIAVILDLTERKRAEGALRRRNEQLLKLQTASSMMASSLELEFVLETVAQELTSLMGMEICHIFEWDQWKRQISLVGAYPVTSYGGESVNGFADEDVALYQMVLQEQTPVYTTLGETAVSPSTQDHMKKHGVKTLLILPMIYREWLLGFIELRDSRQELLLSQEDIALAFLLANQAAIGVQNARLYERAQFEIAQRTQVKAHQEELIEELERKNAELERFTYTVSHDLKSPLVTVQGFIGFLEADLIEKNWPNVQEDLNHIKNATAKMYMLLQDLLELSRLGRMVNPSEAVSFSLIVEEALANVFGQITKRDIAVVVAQDMPVVHVDRQRLVEVLQNLLDNAVKFMGKQPEPQIEIGWKRHLAEYHFFIRDNGIGLDARYHEKVFGLFERIYPEVEGTGVGLALVKRIVELHNGRIWIESAGVGQGATFWFSLPAMT
ncbi:MAG: ATP-binding protein [Chloroflexota bacterium]